MDGNKINIINFICPVCCYMLTQEGALVPQWEAKWLCNGTLRERPVIARALFNYPPSISAQVDWIWMFLHLSNCPKSELVPAWVASAFNGFFSAQKEGQQLAAARCLGLTVLTLFLSPRMYSLKCILFLLSCEKGRAQREEKQSETEEGHTNDWLCSLLMA